MQTIEQDRIFDRRILSYVTIPLIIHSRLELRTYIIKSPGPLSPTINSKLLGHKKTRSAI